MKLHELLSVLSFNAYVAIQNVDDKSRKHGRPQFQKVENINMKKVRNILNYDVMQICQSEKGLWVQVFNRERLYRSCDNWDLVDKYFHRKDQREGRK